MDRKVISGFLIFLSVAGAGCFQTSQLTKSNLTGEISQKIDVFTVDARHYRFDEGLYHVRADTLYGTGVELTGENPAAFAGTIPFTAIQRVDRRTFNTDVAIGCVTLGLIAVAIVGASQH